MQIVAYLIATLIPLVVLFVIYKSDVFSVRTFRFVLLCFLWGTLALGAAYIFNSTLLRQGWITREQLVRYEAPIAEEILKALILFFMVRRPELTYFVDGAIYGFAVGIGFAVVENYTYLAGSNSALGLAIGRVISTNLIHATCSAILGIAFAQSRFQRGYRRSGMILFGLVTAVAFHLAFNNMVDRVSSGLLILFAAFLGIGGAFLIGLVMRIGLSHERDWIEEKLGMEDRVTVQEARVVQRFSEMSHLLAPLAERFGNEKAAKIEKFLTTQAQLGIKRKTLEKLADEKMRQSVGKQMAELQKQMDEARREVGAYAMLYLRSTIPAESSPIWSRLETLIQERAAARAASGGMNLWANLEQKTKKSATPPSVPPAGTG
jgi:RsiW-degrading membrane proteinase PrsW (M82 family)